MNQSFIRNVRIKNLILTQIIDLDDDAVHFVDSDTNNDLFIIDCSGYTKYIKPDDTIINEIGKFRYGEEYFIKFTFDETFLANNPAILVKCINTTSKDFIEAERIVIEKLITEYPNIFTYSEKIMI